MRRSNAILLLSLAVLLLAACVAPPRAGPQVNVTRVPISTPEDDLQAGAADGPGGLLRPTVPVGRPSDPTGSVQNRPALAGIKPSSLAVAAPENDPGQVTYTSLAPAQKGADYTTPGGIDGNRPLHRTRNILLLGTDQNYLNSVGRTDTIMILAVDVENGRAGLVSIPRDVYLPIPGLGYSRINTAYPNGEVRQAGGGIPLLTSTIEKNFGIPIHNYVRIDFGGFQDVIDALGGVDIEVECPLYDNNFLQFFDVYTLQPGNYHMTGIQALYYSRSRLTTSDYDRARRQQQVLMAVRNRVLEGNFLPNIPALWSALRSSIETDLDLGELLQLAQFGATVDIRSLRGMVLRPPLLTSWVTPQGAYVQLPDLPAIAAAIDGIWERPPLLETDQAEKYCPPMPVAPPPLSETITPTVEISATAPVSGTAGQ